MAMAGRDFPAGLRVRLDRPTTGGCLADVRPCAWPSLCPRDTRARQSSLRCPFRRLAWARSPDSRRPAPGRPRRRPRCYPTGDFAAATTFIRSVDEPIATDSGNQPRRRRRCCFLWKEPSPPRPVALSLSANSSQATLARGGCRVLGDGDNDVRVQDLVGLDGDRPLATRATRLRHKGVLPRRQQERETRAPRLLRFHDAVASAEHVCPPVLRETAAWSRTAAQSDKPGHTAAWRRGRATCRNDGKQHGPGPCHDSDARHIPAVRPGVVPITRPAPRATHCCFAEEEPRGPRTAALPIRATSGRLPARRDCWPWRVCVTESGVAAF